MQWASRHPGLVDALHLALLVILMMTPVLISQLLSSAFE